MLNLFLDKHTKLLNEIKVLSDKCNILTKTIQEAGLPVPNIEIENRQNVSENDALKQNLCNSIHNIETGSNVDKNDDKTNDLGTNGPSRKNVANTNAAKNGSDQRYVEKETGNCKIILYIDLE